MYYTNEHAEIYRDAINDKIAVLTAEVMLCSGQEPRYLVCFGYDDNGSYRASYEKPSRTYKTLAGAERAARKWVA